jgi:hypothetical protein
MLIARPDRGLASVNVEGQEANGTPIANKRPTDADFASMTIHTEGDGSPHWAEAHLQGRKEPI